MKKLERKIKRHQHALLRDGIVTSEQPTKILAICNAGLVNGLSEEILIISFEKYGEISNILMPPGKSYCFVCFASIKSSNQCYISSNGQLNIAQDKKPILLSFIESLPEIVYDKTWDSVPPGLIILNDFISENEEKLLMDLPKFDETSIGSMKNRQVKHFGFEFKYDINNVDKSHPLPMKIPSECDFIFTRLRKKCDKFADFVPDQLTVNKYLPGQGIPSHVDTHSAFVDPLMSLSLGSPIVMDFKNEIGSHYCIMLPQRSLIIMSEESRYLWTHGITPRKYDVIRNNDRCNLSIRHTRISYTFRKIRKGDCNCRFVSKCDSVRKKENSVWRMIKLLQNWRKLMYMKFMIILPNISVKLGINRGRIF
ncbi:hypothetical protein HHI36_010118 [Cryptolaemus montrouzieri]|uniref:Fe2OG dioxygenase domain-containing protein n=1 Tax=Cryptolaemus montrouzieri TaxID=559131 RepID=A0ABD2MHU4_9CUCU